MKPGKLTLTLAVMAALVAATPISFAQDKDTSTPNKPTSSSTESGTPRRRGAANQFNTLVERLKLNDDQQKKLKPLYEAQTTKLRNLRQDTSLNAQQRREKAREIRDEYTPQIKEVLTADQFEQYKKLQQPGNRPPRRANPNPAPDANNPSQNKDK